MAPSTNSKVCLCLTATVIIFLSLATLLHHPQSAGATEESIGEQVQLKKMVLGSRPPACMNKCLNCRPCEATLVIPPHKVVHTRTSHLHDHDQRVNTNVDNINNKNAKYDEELSRRRDDGSYYLLSWKCRCGNKIYQP